MTDLKIDLELLRQHHADSDMEGEFDFDAALTIKRAILALTERDAPWISVYGRLPELGKPVQILTSYMKQATAYTNDHSKPDYSWVDWMRSEHSYGSVTHWMPLPDKPE